jgi:hypothetical protein
MLHFDEMRLASIPSEIASIILGCGLVGKRTGLDAAHVGLLAIFV